MIWARWFPPRWRRRAREADELHAQALVLASRGEHGDAAATYITAALFYGYVAAVCPREFRDDFERMASGCAYRAASESDAFGHAFKPKWPHRPGLTVVSRTQN